MKKLYIILFLFMIFFDSKAQDTINVPANYTTIQAAIDTAKNGDVILVDKGIYVENINFKGKNIIVSSLFLTTKDTSYISQTIIDGNEGGNEDPFEKRSVVTFENGEDSTACLCGFTVTNGSGQCICGSGCYCTGGGITCQSSDPTLSNLMIIRNFSLYGGGILLKNSKPKLVDLTITENVAKYGGGISFDCPSSLGIPSGPSMPTFDSLDRCNIFLNSATFGSDLYKYTAEKIFIILDTFTVLKPTEYLAYPKDKFNFDIKNAKIQQANSDLYVNPNGNNANSGVSYDDPLKTISFAMKKIYADSVNPKTIYLANGIYRDSTSDEFYPLGLLDFVSLHGESEENVILEKEGYDPIISYENYVSSTQFKNELIKGTRITNLTLKGSGETTGISVMDSNPELANITMDGAMLLLSGSNPIIENVKISGNTEEAGILMYGSNPTLTNVVITKNSGWLAGGLRCEEGSHVQLINCTITDNKSLYEDIGGIHINYESSISIINSIIWNNPGYEIGVNWGGDFPNVSIFVTNSLIKGGMNGIHHIHSGGTVYWLDGNLDADPLFYNPSYGDFRLQNGSPCIDAGIQDTMVVYNNNEDTLFIPPIAFIGSAPDIGAFEYDPSVDVKEIQTLPLQFVLFQNYPNPFNPTTTIEYVLQEKSNAKLILLNTLGEEITILVNEEQDKGYHKIELDGSKLTSGVYFYKLTAGNFIQTRKMILMK